MLIHRQYKCPLAGSLGGTMRCAQRVRRHPRPTYSGLNAAEKPYPQTLGGYLHFEADARIYRVCTRRRARPQPTGRRYRTSQGKREA